MQNYIMAKFDFIGTGVAIITPFKKNFEVDFEALTRVVNHLIKGKVEYIVVLGTTGESATLSKEEKELVIHHIKKVANKRIHLVLGIGGNNTKEIIQNIEQTNLDGFSAILSVSPYYNKPSQEGIYQHYRMMDAYAPLPIILYNVPGRTGSNMTSETTLRLAFDCKNVMAIKEASGNMEQCMRIINGKPKNFHVISGDDNLSLPLIACGASGVISVAANSLPKDFSDMIRFSLKGDYEKARKLHYKIMPITDQLFADGNPGGVKYLMEQMKLIDATVRLPLVKPNKGVQDTLLKLYKQYK
jgi:4-hydroxy-tetrahydrodipicolinate synthase